MAEFSRIYQLAGYLPNITWWQHHPFIIKLEQALKPITIGLVLASAWLIAEASAQNIILILVVAFTALLGLFKNFHPIYLMSLGAALGVLFL